MNRVMVCLAALGLAFAACTREDSVQPPAGCIVNGAPADLAIDVNNCGTCGHVCAAPRNAQATCVAGKCGRSPCAKGFFDLDGAATLGCEATCVGNVCTGPNGVVTLSAPPLQEPVVLTGTVSGSTWGADVQTSAGHTHSATLGESMPAPTVGVEAKSSKHTHVGGLAADKR